MQLTPLLDPPQDLQYEIKQNFHFGTLWMLTPAIFLIPTDLYLHCRSGLSKLGISSMSSSFFWLFGFWWFFLGVRNRIMKPGELCA